MITAAQSRSARTLLGWSVGKLASTACVSESAVDNFELERLPPDPATAKAIQRAF
jgi:ribosome-binding protein aMBF1 (putative translation factor)